jgi:hypothetical protein
LPHVGQASALPQFARDRVAQVFQYLKDLNEHRNPAHRQIGNQPRGMWLNDLPDVEHGVTQRKNG